MSAETMTFVLQRSPLTGVAYTIHLIIGNLANPQHEYDLFMSQDKLAFTARTTRTTVNRVLAEMVEAGLLAIVETHRFGFTRFRFLMDEDRYPRREYHPPKRSGAIPPAPPPLPSRVSREHTENAALVCPVDAPVCSTDTRVVSSVDTQNRSSFNSTKNSTTLATDKPSPKGSRSKSADPKFSEAAHKLATDEWERRTIKPMAGKFPAFRSQIQRELDAGATPAQLAAVLPGMANFSANSFDFHLNGKGKRNGLRSVPLPISANRDAPEGLVQT